VLTLVGLVVLALMVLVVLRSTANTNPAADGWAFEIRPVLTISAPGTTFTAPSPTDSPTDPSDPAWITPQVASQFTALDCTSTARPAVTPVDQPLVACSRDGSEVYVLGPAEVTGAALASAETDESSSTGLLDVTLTSAGNAALATMTTRAVSLPAPRNRIALVLDGRVMRAPMVAEPSTGGPMLIAADLPRADASTAATRMTARRG
jgi:preprotein translocase subunit SecD